MNQKFFLSIIFLILANCQMFTKAGYTTYGMMKFKIPDGTPTFRQGYKDGCETALYARGNVLYRSIYKYRFDPKLTGNSEYRLGHSRGYGFCFPTAASAEFGPQSSFDRFINPYGYDSGFNAGNINDTWGGGMDGTMGSSLTGGGFGGIFDVLQKGGSGTGESALGGNPLWSGGSKGQFLGW